MQKMSDILPLTIKDMGLQTKYNAQSVMIHWQEIVGNDIASHAYPVLVQSGIVVIGVNNSVWCHHLSMMKENIIDKINTFVGRKLIFDIRFQAGYLKEFQNEENTNGDAQTNNKYKLSKIKLDEEDLQIIQEAVKHISDKYLKQKILRLMRKEFALRKLNKQNNWHSCASCTVLCPPDESHCTVCKLHRKQEVIYKVIGILKEIPWIRHHELYDHVICTDEEFAQAKYTLVASIGRDIQDGDNDKLKIMSFIMLTTGAKIEAVNEAIINKTLDKFRRRK